MTHKIILFIAVCSTLLLLYLWFRDVKRIMSERKLTVDSARQQLTLRREMALRSRGDPDAAAVAERSESILRQAVEIYNRTLRKPWYALPAFLMGFHYLSQFTQAK